jgi:phage baseplate assembly protein gpV
MATRRYSVNPQDMDHQVTEAAGAAVATKAIELTVDTDALIAAGLSSTQVRLQIAAGVEKIMAYIETSGKFSIAG